MVFLDGATSMGVEPEEQEKNQKQCSQISFIYILQTNQQGSFYGKKKWEHLYYVVLRFEDEVDNVEKKDYLLRFIKSLRSVERVGRYLAELSKNINHHIFNQI